MLEQGNQYSASDFIELKSKVKAEMLRRCYTGSLEGYGSEAYDFFIMPQSGGQILTEQANKIIEFLKIRLMMRIKFYLIYLIMRKKK